MIRQKRNIKTIFVISIFVFLIFLSNLTPISDLNPTSNDNFISDNPINYESESPNSANLNLTEFITGQGTNQTVRLCMENSSSSSNNQNGYFEIPSPANNMSLNSGDFLFNFNNNYTTDYIIEDDSALYPIKYYEKYKLSSTNSYLRVNNGSIYPIDGLNKLLTNQRSYFNISSSNGLVNFTLCANFANVIGVGAEDPDLPFDRERILGFVLNFTYKVSKDANITIYIKDICDTGSFKNITNTFEVSSNNNINRLNVTLINENLNYVNTSSCSLIRFIIDRSDKTTNFNTTISILNFTSFVGFELPITNNSLALDFDLRGLNSTINGCYVWIRTLNTTKAINAKLNISLYIANGTMARTSYNMDDNFKVPVKPNKILDSKLYYYNDYHGDNLTYFKFNLIKTYNLSCYNYFIVIKSNISTKGIFSLVTIPTNAFGGDGESREHLIQRLGGDGKWSIAKADLNPNFLLDASEFKLNVTRGYNPSDFKIDGIKTLKIQNLTVENYIISGLSTNSPNLEWGLGQWNYTLNSTLLCNSSKKFIINLTWNNTYIKGFKFNVNYTAEIYRSDNCTVYYRVNYDRLPEWTFNYTLNLTNIIFTHWNLSRLWYVYRNYFTAHNLTIPDGSEVFNRIKEESLYSDLGYKCISLNSSIAKYSGRYSLNLTSPNAIYNEHSYINFKGILWETSGFMYGDNISVSVEIQYPSGYLPIINNGIVNVTLHYPNGTALPGAKLTSVNGRISSDGTKLIFDFNNQTILNVTKSIKLGKDLPGDNPYFLRFFWTNNTMAGCTKVPVYIDSYTIVLNNLSYDSDSGKNLLIGDPKDVVLNEYNLLIASINQTTGLYNPDFFTVNTSISESEGTFTYKIDDNYLNVHMKNFLQNETILNPNEIVRFKTIIENLNDFVDVNVNISVKIVSLANEDWIIAQSTSNSQKLEENGNPNNDDIKEFTLDLKIPNINQDSIWYGYNAPIRQCGAKAIVSVFIQNNKASGTYISNNYSLVVNLTDDLFEGYIIASKLSGASGTILQRFERQECIYLPNKTTLMVNIYDDNYVSSYNQFIKQFELKLNSDFINVTIDPDLIYKGQTFTVSSILTTEFGVPIKNESVYYQYYYDGNWINISNNPIKSNSNGSISFEINTLSLNIENSLIIRLVWFGDTYILNRSKEIPIDLNFQNNGISIQSDDDESLVFRNEIRYFKVNIKNSGNSVLKITDIVVKIEDKDLDFELINADEYLLSRFNPEDDFDIIIEMDISDTDYGSFEIDVTIFAVNILSNEPLIGQVIFEVKVLDKPLTDYVIEYSVFFILAILALCCILVYLFVKRTNKKIELLIKEKVEERPRVSRYVKVSELKPEKIEEKAEAPKETKELEELITKEIPPEEKKEEKVIEPVKLEKIEKTHLAIPTKVIVPEKIGEQEISLKKEKKLPKKVKRKEKMQKEVEKKPLSTKELVKLKKVEKRKGLFKKGEKKPKKLPKKVQVKKAKKKSTTDFDELLKEKGLND